MSWHYVSEHESLLLYQILSSRYPESSIVDVTTRWTGLRKGDSTLVTMSSQELLQYWPHTTKDVGHYSVKMIDQQEASRVIRFIYQHVQIRTNNECGDG